MYYLVYYVYIGVLVIIYKLYLFNYLKFIYSICQLQWNIYIFCQIKSSAGILPKWSSTVFFLVFERVINECSSNTVHDDQIFRKIIGKQQICGKIYLKKYSSSKKYSFSQKNILICLCYYSYHIFIIIFCTLPLINEKCSLRYYFIVFLSFFLNKKFSKINNFFFSIKVIFCNICN